MRNIIFNLNSVVNKGIQRLTKPYLKYCSNAHITIQGLQDLNIQNYENKYIYSPSQINDNSITLYNTKT